MLDVAKCCRQFKEILNERNFIYTSIQDSGIAMSFSYKRMNNITCLFVFRDPGLEGYGIEGYFEMNMTIFLIMSDEISKKYNRSKIINICNTIPKKLLELKHGMNKSIAAMDVKIEEVGLIVGGQLDGYYDLNFKQKCSDFFVEMLDYANEIYPKFMM